MSIRTLKVTSVVSFTLTLLYVAWLTDSLGPAESTWQPINIVFVGVKMPFFPPWSGYLGAGFIFWLVYLWQGRR